MYKYYTNESSFMIRIDQSYEREDFFREKKIFLGFLSCVGFDSGCVRRQMDNFVQGLISDHHYCNSDNLTIWEWALYFQNCPRPLNDQISTLTSSGASGQKRNC